MKLFEKFVVITSQMFIIVCLVLLIVFIFIVRSGWFGFNGYEGEMLFIDLAFGSAVFIFITTFIGGLSFAGNICLVLSMIVIDIIYLSFLICLSPLICFYCLGCFEQLVDSSFYILNLTFNYSFINIRFIQFPFLKIKLSQYLIVQNFKIQKRMTENIIPLRFNVEEVGKHVKGSKKRFTWQVSLNSKQHVVMLDFSFISGKVKVTVDRRVLLQNELPTNTSFQYPFTLDGNALNVIQQGDNFQLRINNKVFSHLYNQMKTNKQFKKYEDQIKDIKVNENQFQGKKLTLNIGGVGGGMKKKPKSDSFQQHNWNAFGADNNQEFPSYFENSSVSTITKTESKPQSTMPGSLLDVSQEQQIAYKKQQSVQNILDFEVDVPKPSIIAQNNKNQFNTMQNMFLTMNVGNNQFDKPSVVIDNSQVDFFSNTQEASTSKPVENTQNIDFFNLEQPKQSVATTPNTNYSDFNTIQNMFATTVPSNNINQMNPINFATNIKPSNQFSGLEGFSLNTKPVQVQQVQQIQQQVTTPSLNEQNFNTMQNMFATNMLNIMQPGLNINFNNPSQVQPQPIISPAIQQAPKQNTPELNNINLSDFSTMQNLFQTNIAFQSPKPQQAPIQVQVQSQVQSIPTDFFGSSSNVPNPMSFSTGPVNSPNMMHLNTYNGNSNFGFDQLNSNQFSTSANIMMKKTPSTSNNNNKNNDLI